MGLFTFPLIRNLTIFRLSMLVSLIWIKLNFLQARYVGPWSIIGDFNADLGAHEKYERCLPNKTYCDEYLNWNNFNNLIHLDTIGNQYTWVNDRRGYDYAAYRVVCNL